MGAFYGSILFKTDNRDSVRILLESIAKESGGSFLLGPVVNGWISAFPNHSGQDQRVSEMIAARLGVDVFHLMLHDDDVFCYWLYRANRLVDHYNSCPDYFGGATDEERIKASGKPEQFQDLIGGPKILNQIKQLLLTEKSEFTFESKRMAQFVDLMGLPNAMSSYEYLQAGERDDIEGWDQFTHVEGSEPVSPEIPPKTYCDLGRFKRKQGDLDGALAAFDKAIEIDPADAVAYNNRGLVKQSKGNIAEALADFDRAIELKPDLASAFNNRGEVKRAKGDWAGAMADYNRAIELSPEMAVAYHNRAEVKKAKGDLTGALSDFDRAVALKPGSAKMHNNRGEAKRAKGDLAGALADYDLAIELDPQLGAAFSNRGLAKQAKRDLVGAMADFNRALEIKSSAVFFNNRGVLKQIQGDFEGALTDFDRALELRQDLGDLYRSRGDCRRVKGDLAGALSDCNQAVEMKPNWAEAYNTRGEVKRMSGDLEGALADFNRALELKPNLAAACNNRGMLNRSKGSLEAALVDFETAAQLSPRSEVIQKNLERAKSLVAAQSVPTNPDEDSLTEKSLVLRTDFTDEAAWKTICAAIQNQEDEFVANVVFISDRKFEGLAPGQLRLRLPEHYEETFVFLIDHLALTHPEHPILVVDLNNEGGVTFRVTPAAIGLLENNLSIANMDFEDYAESVQKDGIFRGF
jgi:tetratricopeptide (TPR) repeat protein